MMMLNKEFFLHSFLFNYSFLIFFVLSSFFSFIVLVGFPMEHCVNGELDMHMQACDVD